MRTRFFQWITAAMIVGVLGTVSFADAQKAARADVALEAAAKKEMVDGDLRGAIDAYQKIIAQYGTTDRAAAAKALVRMGQCYEKLGTKEVAAACRAYERAVRDFSDQKDAAATAQARLAALGSPRTGISYRQVWTGPKVDTTGAVSRDGRYLSYVDWETGDLALHDFATGSDRRLTNEGSMRGPVQFAEESAISWDGKQVVYNWRIADRSWVLRVISLETNGFQKPRNLFESPDVSWIEPNDWSPDGKWIAVSLGRNGGQVALVSTQDGSLRVLKSENANPQRMFFSPDGKYLGLDFSAGDSFNRDVLVLAVDGSGEAKAVVSPGQDTMMGWSPDGKRLLFASDRTGSMALWALRMAGGKPTGSPELIRPEIAPRSLGVSALGTLYVGPTLSTRNIQVATVDPDTGKLVAPPASLPLSFVGSNSQPVWSPDGKYLAYISNRNPANPSGPGQVLVIRSVGTGKIRELQPNLRMMYLPRWAPDGRSLVSQATDFQDRQGIFRIDAATGEASPLVLSPAASILRFPQLSPDGKKIYFLRGTSPAVAIIEQDLAAGTERVLVRGWVGIPWVMPDGLHIAWIRYETDKSETILLVPLAGGEPKELAHLKEGKGTSAALTSTADGRFVLVQRSNSGEPEVLLVPVAGGQPRKLDSLVGSRLYQLSVHPDGKQIAWTAGDSNKEVWVLENFLPMK